MNRRTDEEFKQEVLRRLQKKKRSISMRRSIISVIVVIMIVFLNVPIVNVHVGGQGASPAYVLISNSNTNISNKYVDGETVQKIINLLDTKEYSNGSAPVYGDGYKKETILYLFMSKLNGAPKSSYEESIRPNPGATLVMDSTPSGNIPTHGYPGILPGDTEPTHGEPGNPPDDWGVTPSVTLPDNMTPTLPPDVTSTPVTDHEPSDGMITITVMFDSGIKCQKKFKIEDINGELKEILKGLGEICAVD